MSQVWEMRESGGRNSGKEMMSIVCVVFMSCVSEAPQ